MYYGLKIFMCRYKYKKGMDINMEVNTFTLNYLV